MFIKYWITAFRICCLWQKADLSELHLRFFWHYNFVCFSSLNDEHGLIRLRLCGWCSAVSSIQPISHWHFWLDLKPFGHVFFFTLFYKTPIIYRHTFLRMYTVVTVMKIKEKIIYQQSVVEHIKIFKTQYIRILDTSACRICRRGVFVLPSETPAFVLHL